MMTDEDDGDGGVASDAPMMRLVVEAKTITWLQCFCCDGKMTYDATYPQASQAVYPAPPEGSDLCLHV